MTTLYIVRDMEKPHRRDLVGVLMLHVIPFILLSIHVFFKSMGGDEPEHFHYGYLVGSGMKPYRDFMQHHMPLTWYVLSPIVLFPTFTAKIVFTKVLSLSVLAASMIILARTFRGVSRCTTWAFCLFFLMISPFQDYLDIRPEFFCIPFVLAVVGLIIRPTAGMGVLAAAGWGTIAALHLFLTPRVYPAILFLGIVIWLRPLPFRVKLYFLGAGAATLLGLTAIFGLRDILFFVFGMSKFMVHMPRAALRYTPETKIFLSTLLPGCMVLQLWGWKPERLLLFAMNAVSLLLMFLELNPYPYSTLFILLVDLAFLLDWLSSNLRTPMLRQALFGLVACFTLVVVWKKNIYGKQVNLFARAALYEEKLASCKPGSFQGMVVENRKHPIFIHDYTYFGSILYNDEVRHTANPDSMAAAKIQKVLRHTAGRGIRYVGDLPPCYVDPRVGRILQRALPGAGIVMPDSASSPFTRAVEAYDRRMASPASGR
jgi:hypothetical protein